MTTIVAPNGPSGPPEVAALVRILPDDFAVVATPTGTRGRCVEACRIAVAVLRRAGVECKALACDVDAVNAAHVAARAAGTIPLPPAAWAIGARCDEAGVAPVDEPGRRNSFGGHMVVVGDDWFLDLTAPQFDRPQYDIRVAGAVLGPYVPADAGVILSMVQGTQLHWFWRPEVKKWRTVPAWRQDVDRTIVDRMVVLVREMAAAGPEE